MTTMRSLMEAVQQLDEASPIMLPRGKKVILQVEESEYKRGLIVEAKQEGGYNVEYWRDDPSNIVSAEVKVDGETIKDDATLVYLGFHPEKGDKEIEEANGILPDGDTNDIGYTDASQGEANGPDWEYWSGGNP